MTPQKLQYETVNGPWEPSRVEHKNGGGWVQAGRSVKVKPRYAWFWPKDGKRHGWWGRWKDVLTGQGPDIHIAIHGDSRNRQKDWPSKAQWSRWHDQANPDEDNGGSIPAIPWAKRDADEKYDFRKRKYGQPDKNTWTDVKWQNPPNSHFTRPRAFRDKDGQYWEQHRQWPDPKEW